MCCEGIHPMGKVIKGSWSVPEMSTAPGLKAVAMTMPTYGWLSGLSAAQYE
jgi:hypothetical protein